MVLSDQSQDSFSDDSLDDSYSDYSAKATTTRKRASTTNKKTSKAKAKSTPKRPGRKPIEKSMDEELGSDPKLKRKAQNRAAQRAFRERKEKHVSELQERIRELEEEKSSKESDLELENAKLKQELETLRKENYSLKGSQFTFEYPRHGVNDLSLAANNSSSSGKNIFTVSNAQPLDSPPLSSSTPSDYHSSSSSSGNDQIQESSSSPNKGIDISNNSNINNKHRDGSSSSNSGSENNSPTSNNTNYTNHMASLTNTSSSNGNSSISNNDLFNFNNQKPPVATFGLFNDLGPNFIDNFSPSNNPENSDLFHGKTDFAFSNYRNPVASADDWLFQDNSQFSGLFGMDADQYGLPQQTTNNQLPLTSNAGLNSQVSSFYNAANANGNSINPNYNQTSIDNINSIYNNIFTNSINNNITGNVSSTYPSQPQQQQRTSFYNDPELTPSKAKVLETIRMAKEQGKTRLEVKAVIKSECPDFNVDILCDELRRKAICYDSAQPFSDHDLDVVTSCVKQH